MPGPRSRFRTLMVMVVVVAIALGGYVQLERRRLRFERLADYHHVGFGGPQAWRSGDAVR
jgi:hypothetical protein